MIDPKERAEKIRQAPRNSERYFRKLSEKKKEEELQHALHHDNDSGLSSVDEFVYLKKRESEGK
ncbi:MAG: hypothetical protein LIQ30_09070 [Planctomycetes bacterium]|nr:hypothetical protein [Planctomycetota bacterium]MCC8116332.1 hypothetical protein [Planctomycetota bacterium]MCD7897277.1 hypothetical protein [Planctomycetaceae bacterium]